MRMIMKEYLDQFINTITKKYASFDGVATKQEFIVFVLGTLALSIVMGLIAAIVPALDMIINLLLLAIVLIPMIALSFRRSKDIGYPSYYGIAIIIPLLGLIALIIFCIKPTKAV
jgi:uncharacterized membrane protein YhaH (DUF805 family)